MLATRRGSAAVAATHGPCAPPWSAMPLPGRGRASLGVQHCSGVAVAVAVTRIVASLLFASPFAFTVALSVTSIPAAAARGQRQRRARASRRAGRICSCGCNVGTRRGGDGAATSLGLGCTGSGARRAMAACDAVLVAAVGGWRPLVCVIRATAGRCGAGASRGCTGAPTIAAPHTTLAPPCGPAYWRRGAPATSAGRAGAGARGMGCSPS